MLAFSAIALVLTAALRKNYSRVIAVAAAALMLFTVILMFYVSMPLGHVNFAESYSYIGSPSISLNFSVSAASLILLLMSSVVLLATALAGSPDT